MAEGADSGSGAKGGSKLVPALLVLNSILVAAVLALSVLRGGAKAAEPTPADHGAAPAADGQAAPPVDLPGPSSKLADFVVHLRNAEADRYARVSFEIEVSTEEDKTRLGGFMPRIRDGFIAYLSDRTLEELRGSEAIARTKGALHEQLQAMAPGVKIRALYITDLVIQ